MQVISIENLVKVRESAGSTFRLKVDEFFVRKGEFVVIVGSSGCGKSTLMDMIALVLRPSTSDKFELQTQRSEKFEIQQLWDKNKENNLSSVRKALLGYVLQSGGLFPYLSVRENALVPRKLKNLEPNNELLEELADAIGLAIGGKDERRDYSLLDKKPRFLSGGQRQRAAILRALLSEPAIVLADEPTAAVDEINGRKIIEQFKHIARKRDVSVIMVTHDRHLVRGQVDRAYTFEVSKGDESTNVESRLNELPIAEL